MRSIRGASGSAEQRFQPGYLHLIEIDVLWPDGTGVFYPPLLPPPGAPWSACPVAPAMSVLRHPVSINAGTTLTRLMYVVLRGFHVRGWALLELRPGQMKPVRIQTPVITIRRSTVAGPGVRLQVVRTPLARIAAVPGGGPVLYSEFASCLDTAHPVRAEATFSWWTRAPSAVLRPFTSPCSALAEWVLFVAQPGRPIARAYYCGQHDRCAYAPSTRQERAIAACKVDVAKAVMGGRLPRSAARYAVGLSGELPWGMTPAQEALARSLHERCAPLLSGRKP